MDLVQTTAVCVLLLKIRKKRKNRYWVHPINAERFLRGHFYTLHGELRGYPGKFFNYYRMSIKSFDQLLNNMRPLLTFQDTNMRKSISAEERLSVTLRYLATGNSFISLHYEYLLGATTIREIVLDTCKKLWLHLQPIYMAEKSESDWIGIADQFYERTNFPNCIGAIDGKHIRIKNPMHSGSEFFNYKHYFSTVLLAVADADYNFVAIDVGAYGSSADGSVLSNSNFGKKLNANQLNIPAPRSLPHQENQSMLPFCFVGDEAFALSDNVLRPYPRRNLSVKQKIYNYRLARARRMVECTFGILANKWRIFHRAIDVNVSFCDHIVKACCVLHNYVRKQDGVRFEDSFHFCPMEDCLPSRIRSNNRSMDVRNSFANYFTSPEGSVPWQYDCIT